MHELAEGYIHNLYAGWAERIDQKYMSSEYADMFNAEVEADGFKRGARSFITTGPYANNNGIGTFACLVRGGYSCAYLDAYTLARRLSDEWVPGWTDADDDLIAQADTVVITELFGEELAEAMTPKHKLDITWFIVRCIEQDRVVVLTMPTDTDLNILGEAFGDFIERNFEVFSDGETTEAAQQEKKHSGSGKHGGDAVARKRAGTKKRKRPS